MFYLLCIIISINLYNLLPSDDIWNKTLQYMKEGKMYYPANKKYFIFDESNYTALDINGTKMKALYEKQKNLSDLYIVPNYIFAVDNQNEDLETREQATSNLAALLKNEFKIETNNAMIGFFSMKTNKSRIRVGSYIRIIFSDNILNSILKDLQSNLRSGDYYGAWEKLIDKVSYYSNPFTYFNFTMPTNTSNSSNSSQPVRQGNPGTTTSKKKKKSWIIIIPIVIGVLALGGIGFCIYYCIRKKLNSRIEKDDNFRKVCTFLKRNRNNQAIFTEYCALCLEKLNTEPVPEIKTEAGIVIRPEGISTGNKSTFTCGHQFHTNCITQYKIGECPICKQRGNPGYNQEDAKVIWGTQACLFPILKGYNYNDIYTCNLNKPITTSYKTSNDALYDYNPNNNTNNNMSYSAPSYGGGGASNNVSMHSGGANGSW